MGPFSSKGVLASCQPLPGPGAALSFHLRPAALPARTLGLRKLGWPLTRARVTAPPASLLSQAWEGDKRVTRTSGPGGEVVITVACTQHQAGVPAEPPHPLGAWHQLQIDLDKEIPRCSAQRTSVPKKTYLSKAPMPAAICFTLRFGEGKTDPRRGGRALGARPGAASPLQSHNQEGGTAVPTSQTRQKQGAT